MTEETQLAPVESRPLATVPSGGNELQQLIDAARGANGQPPMAVDTLERLIGLMERVTDRKARAEFFAAKAKFHAECPPIVRKHRSQFDRVTNDGRKVPRMYADLQDIASTIALALAGNGFSYRWETAVEGTLIVKTCYLSHIGGHTENAVAKYPYESKAGCSDAQKYGSAGTYAMRDSLVSVCGLTSCDEDDDAATAGNARPQAGPGLTEDQVHSMEDLMHDVGANRDLFLKHVKVKALSDIPQCDYEHWMGQLERKRKA